MSQVGGACEVQQLSLEVMHLMHMERNVSAFAHSIFCTQLLLSGRTAALEIENI